MTRKALEKLNDKQKIYCETLSWLISRVSKNGNNEDNIKYRAKLRGYLEALEDLAAHFWNREKDMWYLGMDVEYQGW